MAALGRHAANAIDRTGVAGPLRITVPAARTARPLGVLDTTSTPFNPPGP
jgi:hypothetical protein